MQQTVEPLIELLAYPIDQVALHLHQYPPFEPDLQAPVLAVWKPDCFNPSVTKVYIYAKCSTCRKALQWLDKKSIAYEAHPIRDTPPNKIELNHALVHLDGRLHKLFNTSGMDYRAMNMKKLLPTLSTAEALELLSKNGNLIKRPLVIGKDFALAGFKEPEWKVALKA